MNLQLASMRFDDALGNRQTHPYPLLFPFFTVDLLKGLQRLRLFLRSHSYAFVYDADPRLAVITPLGNGNGSTGW